MYVCMYVYILLYSRHGLYSQKQTQKFRSHTAYFSPPFSLSFYLSLVPLPTQHNYDVALLPLWLLLLLLLPSPILIIANKFVCKYEFINLLNFLICAPFLDLPRVTLRLPSSPVQNPAIADVYTEHSCAVNVAKYSPSGFYIASGGKSQLARSLKNHHQHIWP